MIRFFIFLFSYTAMEGVAWGLHKYVMHGWLWRLHVTHHQKGPGFFEKNDWYFVFFALLGSGLMAFGAYQLYSWPFFAGLGITAYGFTYLLVHDLIIHQRLRYFKKMDNKYLKGLRRAHQAHHRLTGKEGGESFGLLLVNPKYFKETRSAENAKSNKKAVTREG